MSHMGPDLEALEEMMDAAWERELAFYLGEIHYELVHKQITANQAYEKLQSIRRK